MITLKYNIEDNIDYSDRERWEEGYGEQGYGELQFSFMPIIGHTIFMRSIEYRIINIRWTKMENKECVPELQLKKEYNSYGTI